MNCIAPDSKLLANLTARCALAGVALVQSTDDRGWKVFIVSRWALTKQIDSLDAVESWLNRVTGNSGAETGGASL